MCSRLDAYIAQFSTVPGVSSTNSEPAGQLNKNLGQPLLLLTILEMLGCKSIQRNFVEPNAELESHYQLLTARYPFVENCENAALAFIGLQSTSFWLLRKRYGDIDIAPHKIINMAQLRQYYWGAKFSEDLFPLLVMDTSRKKLEKTLIEKYLLR